MTETETATDARLLLQVLLRAEERGDCRTLRTLMPLAGTHFDTSDGDDVSAEYWQLLDRAEAAFDFEQKNGPDAFLSATHPGNRRVRRKWFHRTSRRDGAVAMQSRILSTPMPMSESTSAGT